MESRHKAFPCPPLRVRRGPRVEQAGGVRPSQFGKQPVDFDEHGTARNWRRAAPRERSDCRGEGRGATRPGENGPCPSSSEPGRGAAVCPPAGSEAAEGLRFTAGPRDVLRLARGRLGALRPAGPEHGFKGYGPREEGPSPPVPLITEKACIHVVRLSGMRRTLRRCRGRTLRAIQSNGR